ncbi:MAG: NAD(+) synthase [Nanoarchaeota archaeon]|nr:NAD(+) synthase [Nanoarchaeota archaeon]MBU1444954.1 NAD(+) synthase [Nanoarchaeota archaeon]MBU2420424.1 NAD(+) synthase [Nanoarchaeota archaeon]MBU2475708.1 NAD(+) synthase [Nanoarchaeota archaeon]
MKKRNFSEKGIIKGVLEIKTRHKKGYNEVIKKIVGQIKNFHKKTNPKGNLILGLSGGIDSTVVAYLAVMAVGPKKVILLNLPVRGNDEGIKCYKLVKSDLKVKGGYVISINSPTQKIIKDVSKIIGKKLDLITKGNIASRLRINFFYAVAREKGGMVLGTSNRAEFVQGYATKYGTPMSCDFGVLDDLYKIDIKEIAKELDIPQDILNRKSTTGFYQGQTHEEELGATLTEQDVAAYLLFERKMSISQIIKKYGASKKYLSDIIKRYKQSKHKRVLQVSHVSLGYIHDK